MTDACAPTAPRTHYSRPTTTNCSIRT